MRELVRFSIDRPRLVMLLTVALTVLAALAFPKIVVDTDPENMLEEDQPDRVYYREVKEEFGIYDLLVLGIVDDGGVFRPETLATTSSVADTVKRVNRRSEPIWRYSCGSCVIERDFNPQKRNRKEKDRVQEETFC